MAVYRRACGLGLLAVLAALAAKPSLAQTAPEAGWSGQVKCELNTRSDGYAHREIQTWTMTGQPRQEGAMAVYAGTWSTKGEGASLQAQGTQKSAAQWSSNVSPVSATLAVFVRASDKRLLIKSWHSPLSVPGALSGVRQVSLVNSSSKQTVLTASAGEWPFPAVEDDATSTNIHGAGTVAVLGNLLPMQTASARGTADCQWQFSKGAASSPGVKASPAGEALLHPFTQPDSNRARPPASDRATGSQSPTQNQGKMGAGTDPGGTTSTRPLISYSNDNVSGIWVAKQCVSCHTQNSKLNLSGSSSDSYSSIMKAAVTASPAAQSSLLTCPTGVGLCGSSTGHPGGQNLMPYSKEYSLILRWIQDGTQP